MSVHHSLDDAARDRAALYALESLPGDEARAFEEHLDGCGLCRAEVRGLDVVVEGLALGGPEVTPPPALKDEILKRARARGQAAGVPTIQAWKGWKDDAGSSATAFSYAMAGEGEWSATGVPGVVARQLFVDRGRDRVTMLVRMEPGASYPSHRHAGPEECYVLEGDLLAHGVRLRAGDYTVAHEASVHEVQSTDAGCLLLITSSMSDELIDGAT